MFPTDTSMPSVRINFSFNWERRKIERHFLFLPCSVSTRFLPCGFESHRNEIWIQQIYKFIPVNHFHCELKQYVSYQTKKILEKNEIKCERCVKINKSFACGCAHRTAKSNYIYFYDSFMKYERDDEMLNLSLPPIPFTKCHFCCP